MHTRTNVVMISLALLGLVTAANQASSAEQIDLFSVVTLAHAVNSDAHVAFSVTTGFPSLSLCETARSSLANDFKKFLENQNERPYKVESKCVKDDGEM
jgi:hypothetical protein